MSDPDKLILVLKILVVGFGWASIIIAWILLLFLVIDGFADYMRKKREQDTFTPPVDRQVGIFQKKQIRRQQQEELDEFFNNVQEIQNELR